MDNHPHEFELSIVESLESYAPPDEREGITASDLVATPEEALEAIKATKGGSDVLKRLPNLEKLELWFPTAIFRVCFKSGTARYLDIWDTDHFDGFTDMQRSLNDCRAWFSGDGYDFWGSDQTKTGRINCYFDAPTAGNYVCNARLESYPSTSQASVECRIDNNSFGPLTWTGTINQPHISSLSKGGHHFRIRQRSGSFFFLSLTVWKVA
jgi:hypothetical protein